MRWKSYIIVFMRTWNHEYIIAKIPNPYAHRKRVEELLDSLNEKYYGSLYFTSILRSELA